MAPILVEIQWGKHHIKQIYDENWNTDKTNQNKLVCLYCDLYYIVAWPVCHTEPLYYIHPFIIYPNRCWINTFIGILLPTLHWFLTPLATYSTFVSMKVWHDNKVCLNIVFSINALIYHLSIEYISTRPTFFISCYKLYFVASKFTYF